MCRITEDQIRENGNYSSNSELVLRVSMLCRVSSTHSDTDSEIMQGEV